jgi:hypothetical protein
MTKYHVVETTADITNPEPDRRSKDWTKLPQIKAGTRFLVNPETRDGYGTIQQSDARYDWTATHSSLGKLIIANSKQVEPVSVRELAVVHGCDYGGSEILRVLLKLGRVTAADFEAVSKALEADEHF